MIVAALALAAIWILLSGEFTLVNLLIGGILGLTVLAMSGSRTKSKRAGLGPIRWGRLLRWAEFGAFFFWELILANLRLARDVLRPRLRLQPAIVAVPLQELADWQITLLANLITLTPGTLSLEVGPDRRYLVVHTVQAESLAEFEAVIRREFEGRILEVGR